MGWICKLTIASVLCGLAVSMNAAASPINSFSSSALSKRAETDTFEYFVHSNSQEFSGFAFSFAGNSISDGVKVTDRRFVGNSVSQESFSGSFSDYSGAGFSDDSHFGGNHKHHHWNVPEGGAEVTYVTLSGIAILLGILISTKRRSAICTD